MESDVAYDFNGDGKVTTNDVDMFLAAMLNSDSLSMDGFSSTIQQWFDVQIDGASGRMLDYNYLLRAQANNYRLITQWSSTFINNELTVMVDLKRFNAEFISDFTNVFFELEFDQPNVQPMHVSQGTLVPPADICGSGGCPERRFFLNASDVNHTYENEVSRKIARFTARATISNCSNTSVKVGVFIQTMSSMYKSAEYQLYFFGEGSALAATQVGELQNEVPSDTFATRKSSEYLSNRFPLLDATCQIVPPPPPLSSFSPPPATEASFYTATSLATFLPVDSQEALDPRMAYEIEFHSPALRPGDVVTFVLDEDECV